MLDIPCGLWPAEKKCLSLLYRNVAVCQGHSWQFFKNLTQKDTDTALWKPLNKQIDGLQTSAGPCRSVSMRYTHHRGLAAVTRWVRLKFAAMNLKSWQIGVEKTPFPGLYSFIISKVVRKPLLSLFESRGSLTG